jgi:uncharacterized membrane protein (DUF485 family)
MADGNHAARAPQENQDHAARRARYGLWLFGVYLLLYGGFMALSAFAPAAMERTPFAGVNLAVLYGLGLIGAAFLLAVLYDLLCRPLDAHVADSPRGGEGGR